MLFQTALVPFLLHLSSFISGVRRDLVSSLASRLLPAPPCPASLAPSWVQGDFFSPEALPPSLALPQLLLALQPGAKGAQPAGYSPRYETGNMLLLLNQLLLLPMRVYLCPPHQASPRLPTPPVLPGQYTAPHSSSPPRPVHGSPLIESSQPGNITIFLTSPHPGTWLFPNPTSWYLIKSP